MAAQTPDWLRLKQALTIEADRGFGNLQGNRFQFSEFLHQSLLDSIPEGLSSSDRRRWQEMASDYGRYPSMTLAQRRHLVAETRRFLHNLKPILHPDPAAPSFPTSRTSFPTPKVAENCSPSLKQPLRYLAAVGDKKAQLLKKLGLETVLDILFYYPRDYLDYGRQVAIAELAAGETVTLIGTVQRCNCFTSPKNSNLTIFELILRDRTGQIKLSRFYAGTRFNNRGWQERQKSLYRAGTLIAASGLVKNRKYGLTLDNPELEILESNNASFSSLKVGRVLPVYPLSEGVPADLVRKTALAALAAVPQLADPLPTALRRERELIDLQTAIAQIHFPENHDLLALARRRLVFDEFFYLQLGLLERRSRLKKTEKGTVFTLQGHLIETFNQILPFDLTDAQQRAVGEIMEDLRSPAPMNRLVQGDVGSGKTVVGVFAILAAIQSGYQAALMAPTEVLAEQHYRKLVSWFNLLHLPVELLTGSTRSAKRRDIHRQLETGELPLLVGTHALIQDSVNFQRLGLVVIDEQHRFGVHQRAKLLAKGRSPHVLTMTATPIPRTLALTLHGDLDVSQIDELPPGRQPIQTTALASSDRLQAYNLMRREIAQGRQAYVIFPLIEESEKLDLKAAVEEYKTLSEAIFPDFKVGLLHGRLSSPEKDGVLNAFRDNQVQVIVSTTVIEVGVDVPNATVMLIENAERFGLSQLHQLRGRVGRGSHRSYCLLMSSSRSPDARQRLKVLEQSQDGFLIAEMDMRFRGPGEVLGTRQSGLPDFALASLVEDQDVLTIAREAAVEIIERDPDLASFPGLKQALGDRFQRLVGSEILT
jgi:ATP-dependent DNA helicase RecG